LTNKVKDYEHFVNELEYQNGFMV